MKIDWYLRVVLTIIAICLSIQVFQELEIITPVKAQSYQIIDVNIKSINNQPIYGYSIPVEVKR